MKSPDTQILGVEFKALKTHRDGRGFFREVFRSTDSLFTNGQFGQWSHSKMQKHVVKAWHYHHVQTDWWYVPLGQVNTVLIDNRPESPTYKSKISFLMGDSEAHGEDTWEVCVRIPPGVLHGCRVLSDIAHLFYITSTTYDPNEEGRIAYNSPSVDHSWGPGALVVPNDERDFVPTSVRVPVS